MKSLYEITGRIEDINTVLLPRKEFEGLTKAARQALKALEVATTPMAKDRQEVLRAITALREALEEAEPWSSDDMAYRPGGLSQPAALEQEPSSVRDAAYEQIDYFLRNNLYDDDYADYSTALDSLYTAPQPARQPLTEGQIEPLFKARQNESAIGIKDDWYWYAWGVSDGERAHGIEGAA